MNVILYVKLLGKSCSKYMFNKYYLLLVAVFVAVLGDIRSVRGFIERIYVLDWILDKMMAQPHVVYRSVALGDSLSRG